MTRELFQKMTLSDQLDWIIEHKEEVMLILDNDDTGVAWDGAVNVEDGYLGSLEDYIGQGGGLIPLLSKFGIKAENC